MTLHLHAVPQPEHRAVLVPITPDEQALELGRMISGLGHKSRDLWAQGRTLMAIKGYFERLNATMEGMSRNTDDNERAARFSDVAGFLEDDAIPGLQAFLDDQREAGSAADRYWQGKDTARKLSQDERVMG